MIAILIILTAGDFIASMKAIDVHKAWWESCPVMCIYTYITFPQAMKLSPPLPLDRECTYGPPWQY